MIAALIKSRRSVFPAQYNREHISEEEIKQLLESANWAPTHRRTEPWRFKVFHSEESRSELSDFLGETYKATAVKISEVKYRKVMDKPRQSACVIAICMQRDLKETVPEWEEVAATAMAVQNIWLTAHEMKIGMYWSTPALKNHLHKHIELAEGETCLGFIYMGKYDGTLPEGIRKSSMEEKVVWY